MPDLAALEAMITPLTRAMVIINPNNPSGAVYSRDTLDQMVALAEQHKLVVLSDEIYDQMVYDDAVGQSPYLSMIMPRGAMYAFIRLDDALAGKIDDRAFALELLENKHVLVAPGSSFNTPYSDHFRITTLPDADVINDVFSRIDMLLGQYA